MNKVSLSTLALLLALWAGIDMTAIPQYIFPSLVDVTRELYVSWIDVLTNAQVTFLEAIVGMVIGCSLGAITGIMLGQSRFFEQIALPYIVASNAIPIVAIAPLIFIWFGHGLLSKAIVSAFLSFFPLTISVYQGLSKEDASLKTYFQSLKVSRWYYFYEVKLPQVIPYALSGLKVSVTFSVIGAVVAEFIGSDAGLGFGMLQATYSLNTPKLFLYLLCSCLLGLLMYGAVHYLDKIVRSSRKWRGLYEV